MPLGLHQYLMVLAAIPRSTPILILLADDDEDDQTFFRESVDSLGIAAELKIFNDGEELLQYVFDTNARMPDIVFLDLNMPKCNGVDCLSSIRKIKAYADVPVIIYSTSKQKNDILTTYNLGANLYVKKPNDFQSLPKLLNRIFSINWKGMKPFALDEFVM